MTESQWLRCTNPHEMLAYLQPGPYDRRYLLVSAACLRRVWDDVSEVCRGWCELCESVANGLADPDELDDGWEVVSEELSALDTPAARRAGGGRYFAVLITIAGGWGGHRSLRSRNAGWRTELVTHTQFFRDVFGNPFRPVAADPRWLTATVRDLARTIYEDRAFDRLPILADALEDAGCDDADVLTHCRCDGPHVRGCWVVDLILGKS